jgi:Anion-transporting ATPase
MAWQLPRIVFVLGKGGVGRSSVATALGMELAQRGERTLVFGWTVSDPIGPWFGLPPSGLMPQEVQPRLHVGNYRLDETLKLYFVEHLRLPRFYRHVINGVHVRKLIDASPGLAELFFIGHLWWLSTLAAEEANLHFDRIVVDAPATGHGASLFDLPGVLASLRAKGLLGLEAQRVMRMMSDPSWTGAFVVSLPEELAAEETAELVPRLSSRLGRPPLAIFINRSVTDFVDPAARAPWLEALAARLSPLARAGLDTVQADLRSRCRFELALRNVLADTTEHGVLSLGEQLARPGGHSPEDTVRRLQGEIGAYLEAAA